MKIRFLRVKWKGWWWKMSVRSILALSTIGFFLLSTYMEALAKETLPENEKISLTEALYRISMEYQVFFSYDQEVVQDVVVNYEPDRYENVEDALDRMLMGTSLHYRMFNNRYIILYESHPEAINSLRDMVQHLESVIDKEENESVRRSAPPLAALPPRTKAFTVAPVVFSVNGTVTDQEGEPLIGVNIQVKGSSKGTSTDFDGNFTLEDIDEDAILLISYIGYQSQEIKIDGKSNIQIIMISDSQLIEEIVVLGFGQTQRKIAQTASVASLGTKDLIQSPVSNVTNALAGRLPGLISLQRSGAPGDDAAELYIRGRATLNSSTPLVSIDGIEQEYNAIGQLDPNEIENITILKDASATALYGVKGANGVIIVTTRRGKTGAPKINVGIQRAMQSATRIPSFLGSYEFAKLSNEAYFNDNPNNDTPPFSEEAIEGYRQGLDPYKYPDVDWLGELLNNSSTSTKTNFDLSGGTEQVRYFVNVGHLYQDGIFKLEKAEKYDPNLKFNRYNFRSNIDIDFNDDFSLGLNLFGAIENQNAPRRSISEMFEWAMDVPPLSTPIKYPIGVYGYSSVYGGGNPIGDVQQQGYKESYNSALSGMLSLKRKLDFILEGLYVKGNYSFNGQYEHFLERGRGGRFAFYESGDYNDPESYRYQGSEFDPLSSPWANTNQRRSTWLDLSINYEKSIGKHDVTGLLLVNRQQRVLTDEIPYVSQGMVNRIAYGFDNKYFAEFNAGFNGTDNFSKENRYGFFPSLSLGWLVSEENIFKNISFLDHLKLRGSYGKVGNDQLPGRRWLFIGEFSPGGGFGFGNPVRWTNGYQEGPMANPLVTWETATKTNLGVEFGLLNSLIDVNFDWFYENRTDMLITRGTVPDIIGKSGTDLPPANIGETENKGFELELKHLYRINNDFNYFISGNVSLARNKIIFMDEEDREYDYLLRTGKRIGQIFGHTAVGFFDSIEDIENSPTQFGKLIPGDLKYLDLNGDGKIDEDDAGPIGKSTMPEWFFGMAGGFNFRDFDFSFLLQGATGFNVMFEGSAAWEFAGNNRGSLMEQHLGRWNESNKEDATYPVLHLNPNSNNHRSSSFFMKDASYLRLKNAEIGYTFRNPLVESKVKISTIRIFLNGMNLFTWDKTGGDYDPETPSGRGTTHPQLRVFNGGVSFGF